MHQARKRAGMFAIVMASTTGVGAVTVAEGSSITFTEMFSYADGLGDETVLLPKFDTLGGARTGRGHPVPEPVHHAASRRPERARRGAGGRGDDDRVPRTQSDRCVVRRSRFVRNALVLPSPRHRHRRLGSPPTLSPGLTATSSVAGSATWHSRSGSTSPDPSPSPTTSWSFPFQGRSGSAGPGCWPPACCGGGPAGLEGLTRS